MNFFTLKVKFSVNVKADDSALIGIVVVTLDFISWVLRMYYKQSALLLVLVCVMCCLIPCGHV